MNAVWATLKAGFLNALGLIGRPVREPSPGRATNDSRTLWHPESAAGCESYSSAAPAKRTEIKPKARRLPTVVIGTLSMPGILTMYLLPLALGPPGREPLGERNHDKRQIFSRRSATRRTRLRPYDFLPAE